jgi:hypothetical protein
MNDSPVYLAQVVYNADAGVIEFRIPLADGTGDHVLATLPATPPPSEDA